MKVYLDLSAVQARPGRWAALLAGARPGAAAGRAVEMSRVLGYLAREFSTVRKMIVMRREAVGAARMTGAKGRYVLRPFASTRIPGAHDGQWLALVCDYDERTRALVVVDRELVAMGAVTAGERVFSGDVVYEQGRVSVAYCDGEAVVFLSGVPSALAGAAAGEGDGNGAALAKWREYLDWRRKIAETKAGDSYAYEACDARDARAVRFYLRDHGAADLGRLRQRFSDEELRVGSDPKDTRAPQGAFRRIRLETTNEGGRERVRLVVEADFSAGGRGAAPRFPDEGVLRVAMEGELAALDVQLDGLRRLAEGRAANARLSEWLFDVRKARGSVEGEVTEADWKSALLNPEQRACVARTLALEDMLLLWGPPGTGKTTVIAAVCAEYARRGRRVLVASQANLAVEQALARLPASPHVRPAWVSTARRREGNAGDVGRYLCAWVESCGRAVRAEAGAKTEDARWGTLLGEWAERCERVTAGDFAGEDEALYLKHANVVGGTCNETGKPDFVASPRFNSRFDLVIVDEVSKATPPELLLPMLLGRRVMLVGDHRQLPPLFREAHFEEAVENNELSGEAVARFRELVTASWFEQAFRDAPEAARCGLRRQYRMHPQIMAAVNLFYADAPLAAGDDEAALARAKAHGVRLLGANGRAWLEPRQHLAWIDTTRDAVGRPAGDERVGTSRRNRLEAEVCARVLADLAERPETRGLSVAVISFYKAQIGLLRERLRREELPAEWFDPWRDVNTVDQFQGSERDVVIVSLVRTDARLTGEFAKDFRRINVAFSRARRLLIVLASEQTFGAAKVAVPGAKAGAMETTAAYRSVIELAAKDGACVEPGVWMKRKEDRG